MGSRWFRDIYRDAVWESEGLKGLEKAVAETYARHARDERGNRSESADLSWLTYDRLMEKAGIGSRATVVGLVARLVAKGWLKPVQQVSRRATVYRLMIPLCSTESDTTEPEVGSAESDTTVVHLASYANSGSAESGTTVVPKVERNLKVLEDQKKPLSLRDGPGPTVVQGEEREISSSTPKPNPKPRLSSAKSALAAYDITGDEADQFIAWANEEKPRYGGWFREVAKNGDLPDFIAKFRAENRERCPDHQSYYVESCPHHQCPQHFGHQVGNCYECGQDYGNPAFWDGRSLLCPEHPNWSIYNCRGCYQAHRDIGHHISRHRVDGQPSEWKPTNVSHLAVRSPMSPSRNTHSDDDPWNNPAEFRSGGLVDWEDA